MMVTVSRYIYIYILMHIYNSPSYADKSEGASLVNFGYVEVLRNGLPVSNCVETKKFKGEQNGRS